MVAKPAINPQVALLHLCSRLFAQPERLADALRHHLSQPLHVAPHKHRDIFQLDLIVDCTGRAWSSGRWIELRDVSLLAAYPGDEHGYRLKPEKPSSQNFVLKLHVSPNEPVIAGRLFPAILTGLNHPEPLIAAVETIVRLSSIQNTPSPLLLAKVAETLALWPKTRQDESLGHLPFFQSDDESAGLAEAIRHIDNHLDAPPSIGELARLAHFSSRHFSRRFQAVFACTPHQFITARRLDFARQLLREKQLSISETAERLGFSNLPGFSRWFTHNTGMSPSAFRNNPELF